MTAGKGISQVQNLTQLVSERAYADDSLPEDAKLLVVAALESDAALAEMTGSGRAPQPSEASASEPPTGAPWTVRHTAGSVSATSRAPSSS